MQLQNDKDRLQEPLVLVSLARRQYFSEGPYKVARFSFQV